MLKYTLFCLGLVCIFADYLTQAQGYRGKKKKDRKDPMRKEIQDLKDEVEEVKRLIQDAGGEPAAGHCGSNKMHFFFHGHDDHGHNDHEHDDEDIHVHVDLHMMGSNSAHFDGDPHDHDHVGMCVFDNGFVSITQNVRDRFANFMFSFTSLSVKNLDIHVHENGDLRNGCEGLGGKFDPIDDSRNVGIIGAINPDKDNIASVWFNDTKLSLIGPHSILGRSIVGHGDDGGHELCCVIGRAAEDHDHGDHHNHGHGFHGHDHDSHEHHGHGSHGHGSHKHDSHKHHNH